MKKHLALVLALVMVLGSFSFVSAAPEFSDVKGTPAEEAVMSLELLNVLKGYPDGTFKPANTISRAEFAAVAVRVSGLEQAAMSAKGLPTGFNDVPAWHWASGYVGTAAKLGIVNGVGNGMFAPEAPVKYEEAITMIVRALGYEPAAAAKGGYPFGYLIVANEIDLLEDALGTQGTFATRGFVAQITFNALETEMMVQSGYGSDTRFVVSGTDGTKEKYLIEQMGFKSVEGRVDSYDLDDLEIAMTVTEENGVSLKDSKDKTYDVAEGFDFYRVHGVTVKAWLDGSKVVLTKLVDDVMFDATKFDADDEELTLVTADKDYKLEKDARYFYLNNSLKEWEDDNFNSDYAKVVMDGSKVVWADGVTFNNNFVVVKEVDGNDLVDFNDDEYDVKDYLIVKDGKTIALSELVEGDVVFLYNDDYFDYDGLGVVATNKKEGVVTKAYTDSFKLDGDTYSIIKDVSQYLDDEDQDDITTDTLSAYEDEGDKVVVTLDFAENAVLISGVRGVAKISTYGAILTKEASVFSGRRGNMIAWDLVNEMGEKVKFDQDTDLATTAGPVAIAWQVVEYKIEDDGDLDSVTTPGAFDITTSAGVTVKTKDRYVPGNSKLEDNTVVFLMEEARNDEDQDVDKVFKWKDAKDYFGEMDNFDVYAEDGKVKYLVVYGSDAGGDYTWYAGVITKVKEYANDDMYDLTVSIDGTKKVLEIKSPDVTTKGAIVEIKVNDDMTKAKTVRTPVSEALESGKITDINTSTKTITIDTVGDVKVRNNTVIFNKALDVKSFSDLKVDDEIQIYYDGKITDDANGIYSDTFVKYIVVTDTVSTPGSSDYEASDEKTMKAAYKTGDTVYVQIVEKVGDKYKLVTREYVGLQDLSILVGLVNQKVDRTLVPGTEKVQLVEAVTTP